MESSNSQSNGGMFIQFEKPFYYPGDLVKGTIYLNVISDFKTKGLEVTLEVLEHTQFINTVERSIPITEPSTNNNHKLGRLRLNNSGSPNDSLLSSTEEVQQTIVITEKFLRTGDNNLFKNTSLIYLWTDNLVNSGQYAFPFNFYIPSHLPGSFELNCDGCTAYIKYIVTASLGDITYTNLLTVRANPSSLPYSNSISDTKNFKSWCFFSKGTATLNVSVSKNNFTLDEPIEVMCTLDNTKCKLGTNVIVLQLFREIRLKDSDFDQHSKHIGKCIFESRHIGKFVKNIFYI
jgi:hypothetical protein